MVAHRGPGSPLSHSGRSTHDLRLAWPRLHHRRAIPLPASQHSGIEACMGFWTPLATMTASRVRGIVGVSQEFEPRAKEAERCGVSHGGYPALTRSMTRRVFDGGEDLVHYWHVAWVRPGVGDRGPGPRRRGRRDGQGHRGPRRSGGQVRDADLAAVKLAHDYFGRLDVIVNNAGYGQFGMVEEISEAEIRAQLETNLLGALWVTQAALPYLREQGHGHIVQVSSIGGISAFMNTGAYHASKWALEGLSQSLAAEVAGFGIKVTLIEPTGYATDWAGSSAKHATPLPAYEQVREQAAQARARRFAPGDPGATRDAVLKLVDAQDPPLRLFLGDAPLGIATTDYESRLTTWREWQSVAAAAQGRGR